MNLPLICFRDTAGRVPLDKVPEMKRQLSRVDRRLDRMTLSQIMETYRSITGTIYWDTFDRKTITEQTRIAACFAMFPNR